MKDINIYKLFTCFTLILVVYFFGHHWSINNIHPFTDPQSKIALYALIMLTWRHQVLLTYLGAQQNKPSYLQYLYFKLSHMISILSSYYCYQPKYLLILGTSQSNKSGFLKSINYTETVFAHAPNQCMWYNKTTRSFAIESLLSEEKTPTIFLNNSKTPAKPNQCILILKPSDLLNLEQLEKSIQANPALQSNLPIKILISHMDQVTGFNAYFSKMTYKDREQWWSFSFGLNSHRYKSMEMHFSITIAHILTTTLKMLETSSYDIKQQLIEFPVQLSAFHCKLLKLIQNCNIDQKCDSIHFMSQLQNGHTHDLIKEYYETSNLHLPTIKAYNPPINLPHFTHNILNQASTLPNFGPLGLALSISWSALATASWLNTNSISVHQSPLAVHQTTSSRDTQPIHLSLKSLSFSQKFQLAQLLNHPTPPKEQTINLLKHLWPQYSSNALYQWIINKPSNKKPILYTKIKHQWSNLSYQQKLSSLKNYYNPELKATSDPSGQLCSYWDENSEILGLWAAPKPCVEFVQNLFHSSKPDAMEPATLNKQPLEELIIPSNLSSIIEWHAHLQELITHPNELKQQLQRQLLNPKTALMPAWKKPIERLIHNRQLPVVFAQAYQFLDRLNQPNSDTLIFKALTNPPKWLDHNETSSFWAEQLQPYIQQIILDKARQSIEKQYQSLVVKPFVETLNHRFPFSNNTQNPAPLESIVKLFGTNGSISLFQQFIDPFIEKKNEPWQWKRFYNQPLLRESTSLSFLMHTQIIQTLFLDKSLNTLSINFRLSPQFMRSDTLMTVSRDKTTVEKLKKGSQAIHLKWPEDFLSPIKIGLYASGYKEPKTIVIKHPWQWFSIVKDLNLTLDNEQTAHIFIEKEPIEIQSNKIINPLNTRWLTEFKCPDHFT
jgi:hypothetical protein